MPINVQFSTEKLNRLNDSLAQKTADALNKAAAKHIEIAQAMVPVKTGALKASIVQTDEASADSLTAAVEVQQDYGIFVELGTVKMSAQPYFTPAYELVVPELVKDLNDVLK